MILEMIGYERYEDDEKIVFEREVRGHIYSIMFKKGIELVEAYQDQQYSLMLNVDELKGINEIVSELGWV